MSDCTLSYLFLFRLFVSLVFLLVSDKLSIIPCSVKWIIWQKAFRKRDSNQRLVKPLISDVS